MSIEEGLTIGLIIGLASFWLGYSFGRAKGFIEGFHDYAEYIRKNYVLAYNLKEKKDEVVSP